MQNSPTGKKIFYCYSSIAVKEVICGKCSKISNSIFFLFSNKMLAIRAGILKMLVRIANREDPDQTASSETVSEEAV